MTRQQLLSRMDEPDGLAEWAEAQVPEVMREDPIWRLPAYRYSLYLSDQLKAAEDQLRRILTKRTVDQLLDAANSISANIAEGYSRTSGPERAKFFEYANSSAREARDWLFKARTAFDPDTAERHIQLVTRVMKILTAVIPREREAPNTRARLGKRRQRDPRKCRDPSNTADGEES
jgi:four helix bundle protein